MKVSPHVDAAPKVKTTGEPSVDLFEVAAQEFADRLATKTAPETTTRPAPLDEVTAPGAEPALQPLVFFAPAPSTAKAPKRTAAAAEAQPMVFISSDPTPKTPTTAAAPKVSTTGEPSVDLFEVAAQEFVEALRPEARPATPRVFMEEDLSKIGAPFTVAAPAAAPHAVTKIAPSWEPVIAPSTAAAVETVTKDEPELNVVVKEKPFTPTPEEDGPMTPRGKSRRRPRGSDDDQDEAAAKRRDRGAHPSVVVHENVVRRAVNLETGEEEIEVLDAGELAIKRFSKRPARNRSYQSGNTTITTDARGRVSTQRRKRRKKLHPYLRHGR